MEEHITKNIPKHFIDKFLDFKNKIIVKAIIISLIISVIPFIIFTLITYKNTLSILINEYIKSNQKTVLQGSKVLDNHFNQLKDISVSPYKDIRFLMNLASEDNEFLKQSYNDKFLQDMLFYDNDIDYIYFYTPNTELLYLYSMQRSSKKLYKELEGEIWYQKTLSDKYGFYITPSHTFINYNEPNRTGNEQVYSVNRAIKNLETNEVLGVLSLNIKTEILKNHCDDLKDKNENILLLNQLGEVLYHDELPTNVISSIGEHQKTFLDRDGYFTIKENNQQYIVIFNHYFDNMLLAKIISYNQFRKNAIATIKDNIVIAFIIAVIMVIFVAFILVKIGSIIKMMVVSMDRISEGDFDIHLTYKGDDELARFIMKFNEMAQKIKQLINSEYKSKIALKNAQILALQTQINPHFMYNSLQVVSTLALRSNDKEVYQMLNAISNLLKYSLGKTSSMVPLYTEIEYTKSYLYVQKIRFGTELHVEYATDDSVLDEKVPRLILQPLVENSIKHGTTDDKEMNSIFILTKEEEGKCVIIVQDNGKGIEPEMLSKINDWIHDVDFLVNDDDHIGLKNVIARVRLIYDDRAVFAIKSEVDQGTTITIRIPLKGREG